MSVAPKTYSLHESCSLHHSKRLMILAVHTRYLPPLLISFYSLNFVSRFPIGCLLTLLFSNRSFKVETLNPVSPSVQLNSTYLFQPDDIKYLGIHLDSQTYLAQTYNHKEKTAGPPTTKTVLDPWPKIFAVTGNKLLVYKAILKPIWTYGIQLWGTASNSNVDISERFQPES
jgi:hypothetical protein